MLVGRGEDHPPRILFFASIFGLVTRFPGSAASRSNTATITAYVARSRAVVDFL